jgi:hypothetical protein
MVLTAPQVECLIMATLAVNNFSLPGSSCRGCASSRVTDPARVVAMDMPAY